MINNFYTVEEIQEKSVIDDFAKYVARHGIEYEIMTKQKQHGNPMFSFLFGGRFADYYRRKLEEERNLLGNHEYNYQHNSEYSENNMMLSYIPDNNQYQQGFDFTLTDYFQNDDVLNSMKSKLEQEKLSLQLMQEEHYRLLSESDKRINGESVDINKDKIMKCMSIVNTYRLFQAKKQCEENDIDYMSMDKFMEAILASCTKDNICNGKNWVIEHCSKGNNHFPLCMYLLAKVCTSNLFNERLHVVYFINDLFHHCKRKNSTNLLEALESVIVPIYSLCVIISDDEGKTKLNKVLSLWETNSYTKKELLDTMRINHVDPHSYLNNWFDIEINNMRRAEEEGLFRDIYVTNEDTISYIFSDITIQLENMKATYNQMKYEFHIKEEAIQMGIYQLERNIMEIESNKTNQELIHRESIHKDVTSHEPIDSLHSESQLHDSMQHEYSCYPDNQNSEFQFHMPDFSRPPPGFNISELSQIDMSSDVNLSSIPSTIPDDVENNKSPEKEIIPYWRLPAALMVSHIRLSQFEYNPIDPKDIKLPQLRQPSKRLVDISNNFYQLPSHDRPRDTEGWERLALHDFLKAKEKAKIGEIIDDFVSSLHFDRHDEDDYDYPGYDEITDTNEYNEYEDISDFRRNFPPPGTLNNDYRNQLLTQQYDASNFSHRHNNQRSLLGTPWDDYSSKQFSRNNDSKTPGRPHNYNNVSNRSTGLLGNTPRLIPSKIVPLMSLGLPTSVKRNVGTRSSKRRTFHRNSDDDSYSDRKRSSRRYSSRSRSRSRSGSRSRSLSRSQSTIYSRSRSRSYSQSRSRSNSRSRSRSSQSSHGSDKRPYKGGFIARKRSRSRSRSLSRSPKQRPNFDPNYSHSSLMQNLPDRRVWSGMRSELINPDVTPQSRQEDPFSRFRQNKSASYSEWMKDRVVRRPYEEETNENF